MVMWVLDRSTDSEGPLSLNRPYPEWQVPLEGAHSSSIWMEDGVGSCQRRTVIVRVNATLPFTDSVD